jgi:polysaccharide biosynthesis transport protein
MARQLRFPFASPATAELRMHPYLGLVARHWAFVLAALVVGALVALGLSQLVPKGYTATSTLYFSINYGESGSDLNQGATYAQSQMLSFAELARSARVLDPVINDLDLSTTAAGLAATMDVRTPENTVVLDIAVSSGDPELAASIANATAASLTDAVQDVAPRNADGRATVTVRTVENADAPTNPTSPNTRVNVVAGAFLGLVLALLLIVLRRLLDTRVRSVHDLEVATALPVLATIETDPDADAGLVVARDPAHPAAEGYRRLRTIVERLRRESGRSHSRPVKGATTRQPATTFAVASTLPGEGASTVAANLALALAEAEVEVVLVSKATVEGVDTIVGWTDGALVTTASVSALIAANATAYDVVIFDAPSLSSSSALTTIGQLVNGVVLVADRGGVHSGELRAALDQLTVAGVTPVGTVLNRVPSTAPRASKGAPARSRRASVEPLPVLENN